MYFSNGGGPRIPSGNPVLEAQNTDPDRLLANNGAGSLPGRKKSFDDREGLCGACGHGAQEWTVRANEKGDVKDGPDLGLVGDKSVKDGTVHHEPERPTFWGLVEVTTSVTHLCFQLLCPLLLLDVKGCPCGAGGRRIVCGGADTGAAAEYAP